MSSASLGLACDHGHEWPEGSGRKEGPSEWTGGVVLELCPFCDQPGYPAQPERCRACGLATSACDCTGGPQVGDPECPCYEPEFGHQPGCPYYGVVEALKARLAVQGGRS